MRDHPLYKITRLKKKYNETEGVESWTAHVSTQLYTGIFYSDNFPKRGHAYSLPLFVLLTYIINLDTKFVLL